MHHTVKNILMTVIEIQNTTISLQYVIFYESMECIDI